MRPPRQAEFAERQFRMHWAHEGLLERETEAAAARVGVDMTTYSMLLSLQHRDITPEDFEVLTCLDSTLQKKTLRQADLDTLLPSWRVDERASAEDESTEQKCSICLERLEAGQAARKLPCEHIFHAECIDRRARETDPLTAPPCVLAMLAMSGTGGTPSFSGRWLTGSSRVCPVDGRAVLPDEQEEQEGAAQEGAAACASCVGEAHAHAAEDEGEGEDAC